MQSMWGGPCAITEELKGLLKKRQDIETTVVRTELSYHVRTNPGKRNTMESGLFRINIPHEDRLENLIVLLGGNQSISTST